MIDFSEVLTIECSLSPQYIRILGDSILLNEVHLDLEKLLSRGKFITTNDYGICEFVKHRDFIEVSIIPGRDLYLNAEAVSVALEDLTYEVQRKVIQSTKSFLIQKEITKMLSASLNLSNLLTN